MDATEYHIPVMLQESIDALSVKPDGTYFDLTYGGGGHSREILRRLRGKGKLYGFDQDADAALQVPKGENRFTFIRSNFRFLENWARFYKATDADGILADLGVSSHHFDTPERGFSFRFDSPLDMRMNQNASLTASDVLNGYDEAKLTLLLKHYGELSGARRIAKAIIKRRERGPMHTVADLTSIVEPLLTRGREKKEMAKLFQALRIEVNAEMEALSQMLQAAVKVLKPGGRLVVLTYHSIEDRMVKNLMRDGNVEGQSQQDFFGRRLSPFKSVGTKVMVPSTLEQEVNPRSRSAKLRVAERIATEFES
ncbi:MAG: 16S rRNA (cytosine(1402)-N(4))-methyltransferase RsmH [Bacteroidaceae bacterium]|nr:16S rRNA (cytosine(1402)-N(4))-methyltransferase RsmH [Bacteroidaceae bacterium]